jgi:hypothetical protein
MSQGNAISKQPLIRYVQMNREHVGKQDDDDGWNSQPERDLLRIDKKFKNDFRPLPSKRLKKCNAAPRA